MNTEYTCSIECCVFINEYNQLPDENNKLICGIELKESTCKVLILLCLISPLIILIYLTTRFFKH